MKFKIEKVGNMVFITAEHDIIFKAWDEYEFTERKLKNAIRKIENSYPGEGRCQFTRTF